MKKPLDVIAGLYALCGTVGLQPSSLTMLLLSIASLTGCASSQPVIQIERVNVPTYIPIPTTLTQPISVDLTGATWGSAVGSLNAALQTCGARLDAIRTLVPPPAKNPINP